MLERKIEIIRKDVTRTRLTVTKSRVTIKIPLKYKTVNQDTIKNLLNVAEEIGIPKFSLRGKLISQSSIVMSTDNKSTRLKFNW
jgi:hypothetical protein